jgi:hypothetical protein
MFRARSEELSAARQYPLCDALHANPAIHCTVLAITENFSEDQRGRLQLAVPTSELRNGTLTFVKSGDKVYGITCWHVIEHFRSVLKASGEPGSHSLRTMLNGFHVVVDRFIRPEPEFGQPPLDIAIREVRPDFVQHLGKVPLDLDALPRPPEAIGHGYAVGFPESLKYNKTDDQPGYRVSMPQLEVLAEIEALPNRRFAMFSELNDPVAHGDFSGMSGGPIFWSTEENYGIFGIIYEGGPGEDKKSVYIYGELATPDLIRSWINQLK